MPNVRLLLLSLVLLASSVTLAQTAPAPPLTLQEALKPLPQSPQWRALERGQDAARFGLEAARGGSFNLSAGGELSASRITLPELEGQNTASSALTTSLTASVLPWGSAFDAVRVQERSLEKIRLENRDARAELVAAVLERYAMVGLSQRDLEIAAVNLKLEGERLRIARDQRDTGTLTPAGLLEVEAALETAKAAQRQAEAGLTLSKRALFAVLGQTKREVAEREVAPLEWPTLAEPAPLTPDLLEKAALSRPESRRADLNVLDAQDALDIATRDRFVPQGSLSASFGTVARDESGAVSQSGTRLSSELNLNSGILGLQGRWQPGSSASGSALNLGASLNFALWSPGADSRIESARAALDAAVLGREYTRSSAKLDLETRVSQAQLDALNLSALEANLKTAQHKRDDAETRLGLGLATALERNAAQIALLSAQRDLENSRLNALKSRLRLLAGLGQLRLEPPLGLPGF